MPQLQSWADSTLTRRILSVAAVVVIVLLSAILILWIARGSSNPLGGISLVLIFGMVLLLVGFVHVRVAIILVAVILALLAAAILGFLAIANWPSWAALKDGIGQRSERPREIRELPKPKLSKGKKEKGREYRLNAGTLRLDLTALPVAQLRKLCYPLRARVDLGNLIVTVPTRMRTTVEAKTAVGSVKVFGRASSGTHVRATGTSQGARKQARRKRRKNCPLRTPPVRIELETSVGSITVKRRSGTKGS